MLKIAIIDDDKNFAEHLKSVVAQSFKAEQEEYRIRLYTFPTDLEWDLEDKHYFDIFFIDVELPKESGLELAHRIRLKYDEPFIIFVSNYMQYCIRGYEYNAWRYIIKDQVDELIPKAISGMLKILRTQQHQYYVIESPNRCSKINYKDIYYIYVQGKYSYFCGRQDEMRVRKTLNKVFSELNSPEFIYADKGYIVNLKHIIELKDRTLFMRDGKEIAVSAPQYQKVKQTIFKYWSNKL